MKNLRTRMLATTLALLLVASLATSMAFVDAKRLRPGIDFSGPHFNLNVHGVPGDIDKFADDGIGPGRHSIFVPLYNTEPINIQFAMSNTLNWTVRDCDATGDGTASIVLPRYIYLDTNGDGIEETRQRVKSYKVYLVGLGKPGDTSIVIDPVATFDDSNTNHVYYYFGDITLEGHKNNKHDKDTGQPQWQNGTDLFIVDTLTLWNDIDGDGVVDQEWIDANDDGVVDPGEWTDTDGDGIVDNELITYTNEWVFNIEFLADYWWNVHNDGVRLMQVRFYPVL